MAANSSNAQKIRNFNAKATQQQQSAMGGQPAAPIQTVTPVINPRSSMSVGDIQLLAADPSTLSQDQLLRRDALATKENLRDAEEFKKKQETEARKIALQQRNARKVITGEVQHAVSAGLDATTPVGRWLESKPKPGGIATLLIIIAIFLLAIVPVNADGDTRLKMIWLTLSGKTHIDYTQSGTGDVIQNATTTEVTSYQNSLPASQQPYVSGTIQPTTIPNFTPGAGQVVGDMFGLTDL